MPEVVNFFQTDILYCIMLVRTQKRFLICSEFVVKIGMEGVFCMKRKRVFSTCGCVLAMGMAISAVSAAGGSIFKYSIVSYKASDTGR